MMEQSDCFNFITMLQSKDTVFEAKSTPTGIEVHLFFDNKTIVFEFDEHNRFDSVWSKDY